MLTLRLVEYLKNESGFNNHSTFTNIKDPHGRFLLPFDLVAYSYPSDEEIELTICGYIKIIDEENNVIRIEPRIGYISLGFKARWLSPNTVIKLPVDNDLLMVDFTILFNKINLQNTQNKVVYIHGNRVTVL